MRVRGAMRRSGLLILGVVLAAGCAAGRGDLALDQDRTDRRAVGEPATVALEPGGEGAGGAEPIVGEGTLEEAERGASAGDGEAEGRSDAVPLRIRDDGRPSWWFTGPRRSEAEVSVCAEALGPDMRRTREAAIEAGRARLRSELGLPGDEALPGMGVVRVWVWPLPNAQAGANRYAGYVLVTAPVR